MLYEMHITISDRDRQDEWIDFCRDIKAKPLLIELDSGEHPLQLMFALPFETDDLSGLETDLWNEQVTHDILREGFNIIRKKVEVPLDQAMYHSPPAYYESHVKALLTPEQVPNVKLACKWSEMKASKNVLKETDDGREKWYLTKRVYPSGPDDDMYYAADVLNEAHWLALDAIPSLRMEKEAVLWDTNPELDKGWC